jgi:signal transduction histidine kinase
MKKSAPTQQQFSYRWIWGYHPDAIGITPRGHLTNSLFAGLVVAALFSIPSVSRSTGVSPFAAYLIVAVIFVWTLISFALGSRLKTSRAVFYTVFFVNLFFFTAICILFPVLGGDPKTPLWMMSGLYAVINGTEPNIEPSFTILLTASAAPLLTIPYFLSLGADPGWSFAGPLLASGFCAVGYHYAAMRTIAWWRRQLEQEAKLLEAQSKIAILEREQLARDLHDSVGSALSLAGLYGDLLERHSNEPEVMRRMANTLREVAKEGLGDLRGVLNAMAPDASSLSGLVEAMQRIGDRSAEVSGANIEVSLSGDGSAQPAAPVRLALVRLFQESLSNALRHGRASRFSAKISTENAHISLSLEDNGVGFDLSQSNQGGMGVPGMRRRVEELGGTFSIEATPKQGVKVSARLPLDPARGGNP